MPHFCKAIMKHYSDFITYQISVLLQTDNIELAAALI